MKNTPFHSEHSRSSANQKPERKYRRPIPVDSTRKRAYREKKSSGISPIFASIKNFFHFTHVSFGRIIGGFLIFFVIGCLLLWGFFLRDAPGIKGVENPDHFIESTVFYDKNGGELYRFSEHGKRTYVEYDKISQSIKDAIIAAEDQGFFENPGIDIFGLFRAGINYALGRSSKIQGTSTLSQQLIKNTLLSNERSLKRKVQEAYLAYRLNQEYDKEKILEMYLNAIEFGHGANGIEQAALTFFGKSAKDVGPL